MEAMKYLFLLFSLILLSLSCTSSSEYEKQLNMDLLALQSPSTSSGKVDRHCKCQSDAGCQLYVEILEKEEVFRVHLAHSLRWSDAYVKWKPEDNGGLHDHSLLLRLLFGLLIWLSSTIDMGRTT